MTRDALRTKTVPWTLRRGGGRVEIGGSTLIEIEADGPIKVRVTTGHDTGIRFVDPALPSSPAVIPMPPRPRDDPRRMPAA